MPSCSSVVTFEPTEKSPLRVTFEHGVNGPDDYVAKQKEEAKKKKVEARLKAKEAKKADREAKDWHNLFSVTDKLNEIYQPLATYHHAERMSRLDRVYTSLGHADLLPLTVECEALSSGSHG